MERKGPKHVCQKQHRTGTVLALSSPFVNRKTWGKVVTEAWRECPIVVNETPHSPGNYQRSSSPVSKGAWMKRFRIFEDSAPFSLVIKQRIQENISSYHQTLGTQIPHWVYGPEKDPALRTMKHSVKIKPLKSLRPHGSWNKNQGALVLCEKWQTQHWKYN